MLRLFFLNRKEKVQLTLGLDYNRRLHGGSSSEEIRTIHKDRVSHIRSSVDSRRGRIYTGIRGNLQIDVSPRDIFTQSGRYGSGTSKKSSSENYSEWSNLDPVEDLYLSKNNRERSHLFSSLDFSYVHHFNKNGHELIAQLLLHQHKGDEETLHGLLKPGGSGISGRRTIEQVTSRDVRSKIDYILPFSEKREFKAGYQSHFDLSEDNTELQDYDLQTGQYISLTQDAHSTRYNRNTHALYAIYLSKFRKLGYQTTFGKI